MLPFSSPKSLRMTFSSLGLLNVHQSTPALSLSSFPLSVPLSHCAHASATPSPFLPSSPPPSAPGLFALSPPCAYVFKFLPSFPMGSANDVGVNILATGKIKFSYTYALGLTVTPSASIE